ncbi:MAG: VWA domain-containing protein [Pyrinomonadaceae bacterium]
MAETVHLKGEWAALRKRGGDTVIGLITLATLHHGTPGANSFDILYPYTMNLWAYVFEEAQKVYWGNHAADARCDIVNISTCANRVDLRWDNFDDSLNKQSTTNDDNKWLARVNRELAPFYAKIVAYAGYLSPGTWSRKKAFREALKKYRDFNTPDAEKLEIANDFIVNAFNGLFGNSDGLVPYRSGLFCTGNPVLSKPESFVFCDSFTRVRRFEPGKGEYVREDYLPFGTLSISRGRPRGYDHWDMFNHDDVLAKVMLDLRNSFDKNTQPIPPLPVEISRIPTLFLFDVSGSMSTNNKIGQAKDAGLDALRELRGSETGSPPVSIMTFSGGCSPTSTRRHLNFTSNIAQAEGVMQGLPPPGGETPLPQAKDVAWAEMQSYLASNPAAREGQIILLSDGQSTCGKIRPPGVFSMQVSTVPRGVSTIRFMTVGFDVPAGSEAERDLQYLASITGGKYFAASDRRQLIRALQKHVRRFSPMMCKSPNADFASGMQAFAASDYRSALQAFQRYALTNSNDACGIYNLAMAYEANDRYKTAAQYYRQYLSHNAAASDRERLSQRINQLDQDYIDQYQYYIRLIQSDHDYLAKYYDSIYNRRSADLAQEFLGFVREKRNFYAELPEILEIRERWLVNHSKDISSSIDVLAKRTKLESFDSDSVSLLTVPMSYMEELLSHLRGYQPATTR